MAAPAKPSVTVRDCPTERSCPTDTVGILQYNPIQLQKSGQSDFTK
jgi:hypothetical protein